MTYLFMASQLLSRKRSLPALGRISLSRLGVPSDWKLAQIAASDNSAAFELGVSAQALI